MCVWKFYGANGWLTILEITDFLQKIHILFPSSTFFDVSLRSQVWNWNRNSSPRWNKRKVFHLTRNTEIWDRNFWLNINHPCATKITVPLRKYSLLLPNQWNIARGAHFSRFGCWHALSNLLPTAGLSRIVLRRVSTTFWRVVRKVNFRGRKFDLIGWLMQFLFFFNTHDWTFIRAACWAWDEIIVSWYHNAPFSLPGFSSVRHILDRKTWWLGYFFFGELVESFEDIAFLRAVVDDVLKGIYVCCKEFLEKEMQSNLH